MCEGEGRRPLSLSEGGAHPALRASKKWPFSPVHGHCRDPLEWHVVKPPWHSLGQSGAISHPLFRASLPAPCTDVFDCLYVNPLERAGCCRGAATAPTAHHHTPPQHPLGTMHFEWLWSLPRKGRGAHELGAGGPAATMLALSRKAHLEQKPQSWLVGLTLSSCPLGWGHTVRIEGCCQFLCWRRWRGAQPPPGPPTCKLCPISSQKYWWFFNNHEWFGLV